MQKRRVALGVLMLLLLFLLNFPALSTRAAPAQQTTPPAQGKTTVVANLRSGPGANFTKVGSLPAGQTVIITGCNTACDWYQLDSGAWIAAFLVEPVAGAVPGTPVATLQATATATATASLVGTTPTSVPSAAPANTPTAQVGGPSANSGGNLRAGPGTAYARVGGVQAGQSLSIMGKNEAGDWYQLADGNWIAAFLVANPQADVAVVAARPIRLSHAPKLASWLP